MNERVARMLESIDVTTAKGLELGPLTNPVVTRAMVDDTPHVGNAAGGGNVAVHAGGGGQIRYLDHVDTDALRDRYHSHHGFDIDAIVPIDYASGGGTIRDTVGSDAPFDYVVASHVIEHVPDLVGWLTDVRSVLADDGVLTLAVPDHRRCFDILRTPTAVADVVEAHLVGATVPSSRQVFDHHASARSWCGVIAWGDDPPLTELAAVHPESEAWERASAAAAGRYHDVHCWVFTPRSFVEVLAGLQRLSLVPFDVGPCSDTVGGEFFVKLRVADPAHATVDDAADVDERGPSPHASIRERLAVAERERDALRARHDALLDSRSWRVTAPIRMLHAVARQARSRLRP